MKFELPAWVPREAFDGFVEMRQRIRRPLTDYAKHLIVRKLERLVEDGYDAKEVLEQSILNSWQGLWPINDRPQAGFKMTYRDLQTQRELRVGRGPALPPLKN